MDFNKLMTSLDCYTTISIVKSAMYRHKISSYGRESQCCSQSQSSPCTKTDGATICSELQKYAGVTGSKVKKYTVLSIISLLHVPHLLGRCQGASRNYKEKRMKMQYMQCINKPLMHLHPATVSSHSCVPYKVGVNQTCVIKVIFPLEIKR